MPQQIELFLNAKAQEAASSASFLVGFRDAQGEDPAEIALYGEIGDPYEANDARSVGAFLRANKGKPVIVRINSPGGLAYDGITMHNALLAHDGPVTTVIEGMAGSAASIVAMAGTPVQMYENANLFIHRASVVAIGNEDMMAEAQDWLRKIDESIARTYRARTGMPLERIMTLMKGKVDGTVFTAKEALAGKWVDQIIDLKRPKAVGNVHVNVCLREAFNASLGAGRFTSQCTCSAERKRAAVAFGSKLADAHLHCEICPVYAEYDAGHKAFAARHQGLDALAATQLKLRLQGDLAAKGMETARAERIRSRREMFTPAE